MAENKITHFIELMQQANKRVTPQRLAIFKFMSSNDSHPTAKEIYTHIKQEYPMITIATIYKTLEMLEQVGVVKQLGFSGVSTRYEANMNPHLNLICLKCGHIDDLNIEEPVKSLEDLIIQKSSFNIVNQRLDFYGYCKKCQL